MQKDPSVEIRSGAQTFHGIWRIERGMVVVRSDYGNRSGPARRSTRENEAYARTLLASAIEVWRH